MNGFTKTKEHKTAIEYQAPIKIEEIESNLHYMIEELTQTRYLTNHESKMAYQSAIDRESLLLEVIV